MASTSMATLDRARTVQVFTNLKSKNEDIRTTAANQLRDLVQSTAHIDDVATRSWNEQVNAHIFELTNSPHVHERAGGLIAIDRLLDIIDASDTESDESRSTKYHRFYRYVTFAIPSPDINLMLTATSLLTRILKNGGNFGDFLNAEVERVLQMFAIEKDYSRYGAVLILRALAEHNQAQFHHYAEVIIGRIWTPLKDSRVVVREGAAELLATCLDIIALKPNQSSSFSLEPLLAETVNGFKSASVDVIHGSLLAYRELLLHAGMFMTPSFSTNAEIVLRFKDHKDLLIRRTVVTLIPTLAVYDTTTFTEKFLHKTMGYLLPLLKKPSERSIAFVAIGHIAAAVGSEMKAFLEPIMSNVKEALQSRGKKNVPGEEPVFQCIGMLAQAVGPNLTKLLHDQLDLMFAYGLSEPLTQALINIAEHIPPLLKTIQERLLDMISVILSGQHYRPLGAPSSTRTDALPKEPQQYSPETILLALRTLGSFDFATHILSDFVRTCALPYMDNDHPEIRQAAALTTCRLFVKDPICFQSSNHAIEVVSEVLEKLLTVGIADPDATIRRSVLANLDERFDRHLSQAENVRSLFIALNDEVYDNRVIAIGIIGRLANHNPAYVMPPLRKALIQLLTELQYSNVTKNKEESARLLTLLVSAAERLIKHYTVPILKVLIPKADDPSSTIATSVISCIGELARVGGEDLVPHLPAIMKIVIDTLQDQSSIQKRDAAIRTLGQVCSNTGYVVDPLLDYPSLLGLLMKLLRSEQNQQMRRETIKVMGIMGALDPYRNKPKVLDDLMNEPSRSVNVTDAAVALSSSGSSSEEYFQAVVINALLGVLRDPSLIINHHAAIGAIMMIFRTQGLKVVAFLPQIFPAFFSAIRNPSPGSREHNIQNLAHLVWIIKGHVRNFLPDIFSLVQELWISNPAMEVHIVALIESVARALNAEFKPFIPNVLPPMLKVFEGGVDEKTQATQSKIFHAIYAFGANVEEYLHLVIPVIAMTVERENVNTSLRLIAIQTIDGLSKKVNFSDHASRIIHPIVRVLGNSRTPDDLKAAIIDTLCVLLIQLGTDFIIFIPMINKVLLRTRVNHQKYDGLVVKLLSGERLPQEFSTADPWAPIQDILEISQPKMVVNQQHLKSAWDVTGIASKDDWFEWIRRFALTLMTESPSPALRSCVGLAEAHPQLARELFNAAFVSCWPELFEQYQEDLVRCIELALTSTSIPSDVVHILLNLAEFLERDDKALSIDTRTLGDCALAYHSYAQALHYKELEYFAEASPSIIESLININTRLQQHDAAFGTLTLARDQQDVFRHEEWYEKLGKWDDALSAYENKLDEGDASSEVIIGRMRCLHALGEWDTLADVVQDRWINSTQDEKREIAPLAAAAAWSLNLWDMMDEYINVMKSDVPDRSFYRAILYVHRNQFNKALAHINRARDLLDSELNVLVGESYGRAYNIVVRVQILAELEEIITYKLNSDQADRQATIRTTWMKRLQGCQPDVEVWQRILQVRTLVLSPEEDSTMWIKFANLCRKSDRMVLAEKTLNSLLGPIDDNEHQTRAPPPVIYAHLKFTWASGDHEKTLGYLKTFTTRLADDLGLSMNDVSEMIPELASRPDMTEYTNLLARCYFKQGQWENELKASWTDDNINEILRAYYLATQFDPKWYKAWHTWALANFEVVTYLEDKEQEEKPLDILVDHVISAIKGFFRSIALGGDTSLQDTLRLLTLWFKYGAHDSVCVEIGEGFNTVSVDTWLEVVPQIIARIQTPSANVRRLISQLLTDVGKAHPQALIYPLTVASKSSSVSRQSAATIIMDRMREHSAVLVQQALLVSQELIRVAILWHEMWHEGLEEASRLYFNDKNPEGMIAVLEPLHDLLERGPTTTRETSFVQIFGKTLAEAREACRRFLLYNDPNDMSRAWEIYYAVFKKVEKQLPLLTTLDLQFVSPELLKAKNLELAVPGTYHSGRPTVKIASFAPTLSVISSKQRPRRLNLKGSDSREYQYVLKGHEDLRQDERVMQLFGLVNTLLSVDTASFKRHLHIQRYPVIPLAPNAGLLGWVQDSDTLHILVKDYRDSRKILLNIEFRLMLQMAPDYELLTVIQKVEVFEYALDNTTGQDLYRVLWLKSTNSDAWLERRSTYTRSLAVTSMVGYILGLGDRHPSNLLLDRITGKVVHIDFGDCFEVAMHRDKFPEKIPFRLTRMLTHAMEVSGIHGSYRNTCEITMTVLRANRDSLLAVLEAFVYDPLINWRLLQAQEVRQVPGAATDARAGAAPKTAYAQGPGRKVKADEKEIFNGMLKGMDDIGGKHEVRNHRAVAVYDRVQKKLNGTDFAPEVILPVRDQVAKLVEQATSIENLCQCFHGWCAFW